MSTYKFILFFEDSATRKFAKKYLTGIMKWLYVGVSEVVAGVFGVAAQLRLDAKSVV